MTLQNASALVTYQYPRPNSPSINPATPEAMGAGMQLDSLTSFASAVWPSANRVLIYPFRILIPFPIASLYVCNGATASGNFDIGIYDDGNGSSTVNRLISTGSTAQSGTNVPQSVTGSLLLLPGTYYAALCVDNTTATVFSKAPAQAAHLAARGMAQVANGSVTLGSTLTLTTMATAYLPLFGPSQKASV